ncbi:DUF7344 domain-containing protein [Haloterrigena salifodinae]|uniref:DUF7344 domain-containing protein n=1 Tax=Haloterrigena salifodinae TaxID=2675099 RepID=A0A8T8E011_9EURY|nr:hypothetical protein [Haloterrigena salifodinae]QRV15174.1 hypothetical protein JMJ58_20070 [Haloterrigena salifodinae]
MESERLSLDIVYGLLSEARCRYLLYYFLKNDHANIESISLQIAAWEQGESIEVVTEAQKQRVTTSLVHSHLPKLEDHDLIEHDNRTGDVIVSDGFDEISETVRQARASEDEVTVTGSSMESFLYSEPVPSSNREQ